MFFRLTLIVFNIKYMNIVGMQILIKNNSYVDANVHHHNNLLYFLFLNLFLCLFLYFLSFYFFLIFIYFISLLILFLFFLYKINKHCGNALYFNNIKCNKSCDSCLQFSAQPAESRSQP